MGAGRAGTYRWQLGHPREAPRGSRLHPSGEGAHDRRLPGPPPDYAGGGRCVPRLSRGFAGVSGTRDRGADTVRVASLDGSLGLCAGHIFPSLRHARCDAGPIVLRPRRGDLRRDARPGAPGDGPRPRGPRGPPSRETGALVKNAGHDWSHPGFHEKDLPGVLKPDFIMPVGPFRETLLADSIVEELDRRTYSSQWDVPEDIHRGAIEPLRAKWKGKEFPLSHTLEVTFWRSERLLEIVKA